MRLYEFILFRGKTGRKKEVSKEMRKKISILGRETKENKYQRRIIPGGNVVNRKGRTWDG